MDIGKIFFFSWNATHATSIIIPENLKFKPIVWFVIDLKYREIKKKNYYML